MENEVETHFRQRRDEFANWADFTLHILVHPKYSPVSSSGPEESPFSFILAREERGSAYPGARRTHPDDSSKRSLPSLRSMEIWVRLHDIYWISDLIYMDIEMIFYL
jgi:hypothetical protein